MKLSKEQVDKGEFKRFDPETHEFVWHEDGSCTVLNLQWWDDASYARYQGEGFRDQRDVDRYYGRCPDCGDVLRTFSPRCHCELPPVEPQEKGGESPPTDPDIPF